VRIDFAPCAKFFGGSEQPRETEILPAGTFRIARHLSLSSYRLERMNSFRLSILAVVGLALAACETTRTSPSAVQTGITTPGAGGATGLGTATSTSNSHSGQY